MQVEFIQTPDRVQILNDGAVFFNDTYDHYSNGIVRLLGVPEVELEKFMKLAASRLRFLDNPEYKTLNLIKLTLFPFSRLYFLRAWVAKTKVKAVLLKFLTA